MKHLWLSRLTCIQFNCLYTLLWMTSLYFVDCTQEYQMLQLQARTITRKSNVNGYNKLPVHKQKRFEFCLLSVAMKIYQTNISFLSTSWYAYITVGNQFRSNTRMNDIFSLAFNAFNIFFSTLLFHKIHQLYLISINLKFGKIKLIMNDASKIIWLMSISSWYMIIFPHFLTRR